MCIYWLFMCPWGLGQVRGSRKGWLQKRLEGGGGGLRRAAPTSKDTVYPFAETAGLEGTSSLF